MFRLILRFTLPVIILCAVLTALAPLVYQRDIPPTPLWDIFGFDACALPCWAGITVGTTPFSDALPSLQTNVHALSEYVVSGSQVYVWGNRVPYVFSALIAYSQGDVGSFRLTITLPPDQFITRLGMPDCVFAAGNANAQTRTNIVYWVEDHLSIGAWVRGDSEALFTSSEAIYALWVGRDDPTACEQKGTILWRGIAPFWRYEQWEAERAD